MIGAEGSDSDRAVRIISSDDVRSAGAKASLGGRMIWGSALHALQVAIGVGLFALLNDIMAMALNAAGILLPGSVAALVILAILLIVIPIKEFSAFVKPAGDLLLLWLPFLFVPALVDFPLIFTLIPGWDYPKLAVVIIIGVITIATFSGWLLLGVGYLHFRITGQREATELSEERREPTRKKGLFGNRTLLCLIAITIILTISYILFPNVRGILLFLTMLIVMPVTYTIGQYPSRKYPGGHWPNSLVVSSALSIIYLYILSTVTDTKLLDLIRQIHSGAEMNMITGYSQNSGAGDVYLYLLNAAIVAMALPVYQQKHALLIHGFDMVIVGVMVAFMSIILTLGLCRLFLVSRLVSRSFALRTVTAPIAMASIAFIQGYPGIAGSASVVTGVFGGVFWRRLVEAPFNRFRDPLTRGFAIGCSCHGLGTAILAVDEPDSTPFSTVAFVIVGVASSALISIPGVRDLIDLILS